MKTLLITILFCLLFVVGCSDDPGQMPSGSTKPTETEASDKSVKDPNELDLFSIPLVVEDAVKKVSGSTIDEILEWAYKNVEVEDKRFCKISKPAPKTGHLGEAIWGNIPLNERYYYKPMDANEPYTCGVILDPEFHPELPPGFLNYLAGWYRYQWTVTLPEELPDFAKKILDRVSKDDVGKSIYEIFPWLPRTTTLLVSVIKKTGEIIDLRCLDVRLVDISDDKKKIVLRTKEYQLSDNPTMTGHRQGRLMIYIPHRVGEKHLEIKSWLWPERRFDYEK